MPHLAPLLRGPLAAHPQASAFAAEVLRVHRRYAEEVVAKNRLCPFLRDVETGFGSFVVMLDPRPELDVAAAVQAVREAGSPVIHLVYPCVRPASNLFERFAGRIASALKEAVASPPVMATFHPELAGDPCDPYRMVGLLRRAPDPFIQFIPEGMHAGGTQFAGAAAEVIEAPLDPSEDSALVNFKKLKDGGIELVAAAIAEIHADRHRSYAPFREALGLA